MFRIQQGILLVSTLLLSWLLMQIVHEAGHMAVAWATHGYISRVELSPFSISRTDVRPNPHPLAVVWGGPLIGIALPLIAYGLFALLRLPRSFLKFFAGFCLIANGAYIGVGSFQRIGDCGEMLRHGSPIWMLWLFGLLTVPLGLLLWNGIGRYFALGANHAPNIGRAAAVTTASLATVAILEMLLSSR